MQRIIDPQRMSTCERPFTCEGNYLFIIVTTIHFSKQRGNNDSKNWNQIMIL